MRRPTELIEDTYDFYAQDSQGNVWYFGESSAQYENGYIVRTEGSWMAGVDGAKPGIIMPAAPHAGQSYRQEFSLGVAEDSASIVSLGGSQKVPAGSYSDVLETNEYSGLEPDADENKFYAPGVGNILTVDNVTGEQDPLVSVKNDRPRSAPAGLAAGCAIRRTSLLTGDFPIGSRGMVDRLPG